MQGTIKRRDGQLYVVYTTTADAEPVRHVLWWKVATVHRDPYNNRAPVDGDTVEYRGNGAWSASSAGSGGSVKTGDGTVDAEFIEKTEVLPPVARGKKLRWYQGQWERLMSKGWMPTGEGKR